MRWTLCTSTRRATRTAHAMSHPPRGHTNAGPWARRHPNRIHHGAGPRHPTLGEVSAKPGVWRLPGGDLLPWAGAIAPRGLGHIVASPWALEHGLQVNQVVVEDVASDVQELEDLRVAH